MGIVKTIYKPIKKESPVLQHLYELDKKRAEKKKREYMKTLASKKIFTIIVVAAILSSCGPGRWVTGNSYKIAIRERHKAQRLMRDAFIKQSTTVKK